MYSCRLGLHAGSYRLATAGSSQLASFFGDLLSGRQHEEIVLGLTLDGAGKPGPIHEGLARAGRSRFFGNCAHCFQEPRRNVDLPQASDVACGLYHLHCMKIVHGDLKGVCHEFCCISESSLKALLLAQHFDHTRSKSVHWRFWTFARLRHTEAVHITDKSLEGNDAMACT